MLRQPLENIFSEPMLADKLKKIPQKNTRKVGIFFYGFAERRISESGKEIEYGC
jgi:hypothetical protein